MQSLWLIYHEEPGTHEWSFSPVLLFVTELNTIETTELGFLDRKQHVACTLARQMHSWYSFHPFLSYTFRLSAQLCGVHGHPFEKGGAWPLLPLLPRKREAQTKAEGMQHGSLPIEVSTIAHAFQRNDSTPIGTQWFLHTSCSWLLIVSQWQITFITTGHGN